MILEEIKRLIPKLVTIESTNSWLVPEGAGEKNVQEFIAGYLKEIDIESRMEEIDGEHYNLTATVKGNGGGKSITLYAHADTVGRELWYEDALVPRISGDKIIGLGAADDKGFCAAIMIAMKVLKTRNRKLRGDVNICFIADEEGTSMGAMDYVKKHEPTATLILESAPLEYIGVTHQGFGWLKIVTKGKAGHGSAGEDCTDAIYHMAEVIIRLQKNQRENFAKNIHPMNGETVYHTGYIKGGTDFASYPDRCELGIEIGTQPGETMNNRIMEIEAIFKEVKSICPDFEGSVEIVIEREPYVAVGHEGLFEILARNIEKYHGMKAKAVGDNSWGDAQLFQSAGFSALGLGSRGGNLHAPQEWVSISEMEKLIEVLVDTVEEYCG
ncbi:MAG: M20/M25/M40 family metallo-hydrolase [Anaerovoracaceae bacterium]